MAEGREGRGDEREKRNNRCEVRGKTRMEYKEAYSTHE
jgi:hypothetical protein